MLNGLESLSIWEFGWSQVIGTEVMVLKGFISDSGHKFYGIFRFWVFHTYKMINRSNQYFTILIADCTWFWIGWKIQLEQLRKTAINHAAWIMHFIKKWNWTDWSKNWDKKCMKQKNPTSTCPRFCFINLYISRRIDSISFILISKVTLIKFDYRIPR